ncbi:collagen alpha-1(XIV) chain-like [Patiria miniata]|uniref:VWFA domain-containing protein n=1 Tax=Patiria miniata TaxID=46514 RepID=A0A914ANI3_PATMI|nr:collagen alpha-1(XIV) chain-like [Patiria miniata]
MLTRGLFVLFSTAVLFSEPAHSQRDATLERETFGTAVVEATRLNIDRLNRALRANHRFFRRLAWVETADGTSSITYSNRTYHGGIWRVDRSVYEATLALYNDPSYAFTFSDIQGQLGINWSTSTWEDGRRPLYSALAARLYFLSLGRDIPQDLNGQAILWREEYHDQPTDTVDNFIRKVQILESEQGCSVKGIDLVFVLDSSWSVTSLNFDITKNFVASVVDSFDIGADKTRVGVIKYATDVTVEFNLNEYTDKALLIEAIGNIYFTGGETHTVEALETVESEAFLVANGARADMNAVPRVAVVITDGRSQDGPAAVAVPADRARQRGITIFAIGVTDNVNDAELNAIANQPNDTYVFRVSSFNTMDNIMATLQDKTCNAPSTLRVPVLNNSLSLGDKQFLAQPITEEGVTLDIAAAEGNVVMYVSTTTPNPNEALHDYRLEATEGQGRAEVFIGPEVFVDKRIFSQDTDGGRIRRQAPSQNDTRDGSTIGTVYMTLEGLQDTNDFVLRVTEGDVTAELTTVKPEATPAAGAAKTIAYIDLNLKALVAAVMMKLAMF